MGIKSKETNPIHQEKDKQIMIPCGENVMKFTQILTMTVTDLEQGNKHINQNPSEI